MAKIRREPVSKSRSDRGRSRRSVIRVGAFGKPDSFSHAAAKSRFGAGYSVSAIPLTRDVFAGLSEGEIDIAVVPIENTTGGWVSEVISELMKLSELDPKAQIIEELDLPVVLSLAGKCRPDKISTARRVYSHPYPLMHSGPWLSLELPKVQRVEVSSTSEAAERASAEKNSLAICNAAAAKRYGLKILVPKIQTAAINITRFAVLSKKIRSIPGRKIRSSLWFAVPDKPGSLWTALGIFRKYKVNMTRIESRSFDAFESYRFYIELEGSSSGSKLRKTFAALGRVTQAMEIIGSYPVRVLAPN